MKRTGLTNKDAQISERGYDFLLGSWSFGNDFARYVLIFGADNNLLSHTDN